MLTNDNSTLAAAAECIDDWSNSTSMDTSGFVHHEMIEVASVSIECVSTLSPLDMVQLSEGSHDATGHVIWMGASLFLKSLSLLNSRQYFENKLILELGTGTGICSIVVLRNTTCQKIVMTDNDAAVLELCRRNCTRNIDASETKRWSVEELEWGKESTVREKFDTIIATDVLYDIDILDALLQSVRQNLLPNGHFLLSHVPRASLPGHGKEVATAATGEQLEQYIVECARPLGIILQQTIRPSDLPSTTASIDIQDMHDAGAAILIFQLVLHES